MTRNIVPVLILIVLLCLQARADQVTLKNGDRLSGTIVKADAKSLVIKTEFAGEVTVAWDAVTQITSAEPLYITLADGRTVSGLVSTAGDQVEVRASDGGTVATPKAGIAMLRSEEEQQAFMRMQRPGWLELWSGSADLGLALTTGNSDTTNIALGMAMARTTTRDKMSVYAAALYARDSTEEESRTIANTIRGGFRYDRDITPRWFGYGLIDLETNDLQDLNLRLVPGGGIGFHAIRSERTQLDILGGAAWNKEYFDGEDNDRSSAEVIVGQTLSYRLAARTSLKEQFFYFPNLSEGGEYRLNFDASLVTDITRRIGWQLTVSDRYLSNPPIGFEKNDLLLTTGLSFKIGAVGK